MKIGRSTKFPWQLWVWTEANESLFDLSKEELEMFKLFISYA